MSRAVAAGRLRALHHGVYVVGHDHLGAWGRYWGAVLACGDDAVLSHRPAGAAWKLLPVGAGKIDVSVRGAGGRSRPGLRIHRRPSLWPDHVTTHHGLPIATPERTLLDLAATTSPRTLREALRQAEQHRLVDHATLAALATSRLPGAPVLREAIALPTTESPLEDDVLAFCDRHGLPRPRTQVPIGRYRADFLWPEARLILEADGRQAHRDRFEEDRERDIALAAEGYMTLRVTRRGLTRTTADRIRAVLSERLP